MEVVNGYPCKNCTDVEYAKKGVDPARPRDGPNGVNSPEKKDEAKAADRGPAVSFGGQLAQSNNLQAQAPQANGDVEAVRQAPYIPGASVSFKV